MARCRGDGPRSGGFRGLRRAVLPVLLGALALGVPASDGEPEGIEAFLAVRGERVLAAEFQDVRLPPASVLKLLVAVAALEELGPDHRIETRLEAHGELRDGTLAGDLVLRGGADPTWGEEGDPGEALSVPRGLGEDLRRRGVRRVEGDLVVDATRFPGRTLPTSRARSEAGTALGAPTSAIAWNRNVVPVELGPGPRIGAPARLRPPTAGWGSDLEWENRVTTVGRERHGRGTVDLLPRWSSAAVLVEGEFPISEPVYRIEVAHPRPLEAAAARVAVALEGAGVELEGKVRVGAPPPGPPVTAVSRFSPPLRERLEPILRDSSNWHAEMLVRSLGAEVEGEGRTEVGLEVVRRLLAERVGISPEAVVLDDGSGVSPYSLVTVRAVVDTLRWAAGRPWFPELTRALPGPGQGTLASWPRGVGLVAKTGTGRNTLALAGILDPASPRPAVFCAITAGSPLERPILRRRIVDRLRALPSADDTVR